jgi:membrane-associated phospholipid phosphatase
MGAEPARRSVLAEYRQAHRAVLAVHPYPAPLLTPFFEEVRFIVNATSPGRPYWFEAYLYAADRTLFGTTPAVAISKAPAPVLDELMHGLYFSYYPLIIGGVVTAWIGSKRAGATPGAGFQTTMTSMVLGFFFAYVWYPFLPARGPWENRELMSGLREFHGFLFVPLIQWIIDRAAVSGGCFPSAHVAGTCGLLVGLATEHRRLALWFSLIAVGLGVSCVYTRYHHAVDVIAGLIVGVAGGTVGHLLTLRCQAFGHQWRVDRPSGS